MPAPTPLTPATARKPWRLINGLRFNRHESGKLVKYKAGTHNDVVRLTDAEAFPMLANLVLLTEAEARKAENPPPPSGLDLPDVESSLDRFAEAEGGASSAEASKSRKSKGKE